MSLATGRKQFVHRTAPFTCHSASCVRPCCHALELSPLASHARITLILLHEDTNILRIERRHLPSVRSQLCKTKMAKTSCANGASDRAAGAYSHGTSPTSIQSPSPSSYTTACSHAPYPSMSPARKTQAQRADLLY
jgi:hypothetical protein